jgi:hypothetical protein
MKKYFPIVFILLVVIALLIWKRPGQPVATSSPMEESIQASNMPTSNPQVASQGVSSTAASISSASANAKAPINDSQSPEAIRKSMESQNLPIEFYGEVVDQNTNPVAGMKIQVKVRHWNVVNPTAFGAEGQMISVEKETGMDGRFEIRDVTGDGFDVESIQRAGYKLSPNTPNHFGASSGSYENRIIIKVWKIEGSDQLVSQDMDTRIPYDGTPVIFNLLTGQKNVGDSTAGDLRVTLTRNPLNIPLGYKKAFGWHATIYAVDGGLIQSDDEFMYVAPEEGYQPKIEIDMPADSTDWKSIYNISFFAKTRGGNVYSRVKFVFRVDSPKEQTGFTITSSANPTGSRSLQQ